jgi:hypothetical protein
VDGGSGRHNDRIVQAEEVDRHRSLTLAAGKERYRAATVRDLAWACGPPKVMETLLWGRRFRLPTRRLQRSRCLFGSRYIVRSFFRFPEGKGSGDLRPTGELAGVCLTDPFLYVLGMPLVNFDPGTVFLLVHTSPSFVKVHPSGNISRASQPGPLAAFCSVSIPP